ncbi:MAG: penicillin acylase family protein, partial [Flavobacteriales bacterium]|nr:penicillin acylase family protein [Flavobacteriales bacterium]
GKIAQVDEVVERRFEDDFSTEFKEYLSAYAQGMNAFAAAHPKEHLCKKLFPITDRDIIKGQTLTLVFLTSVYIEIQQIFTRSIVLYERKLQYTGNLPDGSNAFAFNKNKTANGHTYLAINSHQPLEGLFSWYEAHLVSEEGLNILGGTFPGGVSIFHGVNENLAWAATLNHPDLCDVYKLEMHPKEKLQYKFDDAYETLIPFKAKVKVKVGQIRIPITRTFYNSKYGVTIKNKDGFYSLRFPANMEIASTEILWRMNKAKDLEEFNELLGRKHLPGTNNIYADKKGNIQFISLGQFAYRDSSYDWLSVLPGNTSKTLWEPKFHPTEDLLTYLNPKAGYLFNTNGTPFFATAKEENLHSKDFDPTFGYQDETKINNRAIRADKLINDYDKITWEDFKTIKYDRKFNDEMKSYNIGNMNLLMELDPEKYPDLKESLAVINAWDHTSEPDNMEAALLVFAFNNIMKIITSKAQQYAVNVLTEEQYVKALRDATKHIKKYFGALRVRLGDVQKHVRGDKEIGVGGVPGVLASNITQPYKKGMLKTFVGDSYIILVDFDGKGLPKIETINAFGASNRAESPHYTDQMELWAAQKTKTMTLDKELIYKEAERVYHPE